MTDIVNALGNLGTTLGTVKDFFEAVTNILDGVGHLTASVAGLGGFDAA